MSHESYIVDAVRTPIGRIGGALAGVRPDDLAASAVRTLAERSPDLDPSAIDEAYLGDGNQAGEDNRNVARMAVLLAGLPTTIPGATVNRLCGSGLEAVIAASRAISVGDADVVIAGGVESMSPRAVGAAETRQGLSDRARAAVEHHPRVADDEPQDARRVDRVARRGRRAPRRQVLDLPRGTRRLRPRIAPAGRRGLERRAFRGRDRAGPRHRARRVHPRRHHDREAGEPAHRVPRRRRHRHGRQRVADERRLGGHARHVACRSRPHGSGADRTRPRRGHERCRTASLRNRPGRGRPHRAATGRHRLGRPVEPRAQRGLRRPEPGVPAASGRSSIPRS